MRCLRPARPQEIVRAKGLTRDHRHRAVATTLDGIIAAEPKEWERLKAEGAARQVLCRAGDARDQRGPGNPQVVNACSGAPAIASRSCRGALPSITNP